MVIPLHFFLLSHCTHCKALEALGFGQPCFHCIRDTFSSDYQQSYIFVQLLVTPSRTRDLADVTSPFIDASQYAFSYSYSIPASTSQPLSARLVPLPLDRNP